MSGARDPEAEVREACDRADWDQALTLGLRAYGRELLGFLVSTARDAAEADEAFAMTSEELWRSLPQFRWQCTFRTYAYTLARHAWSRLRKEPARRVPREPLSSPSAERVVAALRSQTAEFLRTESKGRLAAARESLDSTDRALLILRVNRGLPWRDIAEVLSEGEDADLDRRAAQLRKRFERLKEELRAKLGVAVGKEGR